MKKFIVGLLCGIVLCFSTAAVASNGIKAVLFPSKITFHSGNQVKELSHAEGTEVLNYNNRTYIPLRAFVEATGAVVNFSTAAKNNGNLNQIEVFDEKTLNGLNITSNDNYVTIGNLIVDDREDGSIWVTGGTIKINKDISGKQIFLEAVEADGTVRGTSEYVFIDNENVEPPKAGEVRSFKSRLIYEGKQATIRVKVLNIANVKSYPDLDLSHPVVVKPIDSKFIPPSNSMGEYPIAERAVLPFTFYLTNTSEDTIVVDSFPLSMVVKKGSSPNANNPILYEFKVPSVSGKLAPREGFEISIPWYLNGKDGPVKPGEYLVSLTVPSKIEYTIEKTGEKQTWDMNLKYGNTFGAILK